MESKNRGLKDWKKECFPFFFCLFVSIFGGSAVPKESIVTSSLNNALPQGEMMQTGMVAVNQIRFYHNFRNPSLE